MEKITWCFHGIFQDSFFYSLVYDPQQKTLLADKGEIRVGSKFQAQVQHFPKLKEGKPGFLHNN